jgi:signal transduction histidine kinase
VCASATDDEGAVRSVLIQLVMNLDAVSGWVGLADPSAGEIVYDSMGRARDAAPVAEAAQALGVGLVDDAILPVGEAATAGFPGGAAGGRGLFLQFLVSGGEPGWLLLVGPPGRGLPADAEPALRTAAAILGLTVARLHALAQLRGLNRALERKVAERTAQLRRDKESLEDRVRERTRELEKTKRAALETERKLYDRGRQEGVRQVAAGVAHELNNPLSAVSVNLQVVLELLAEADGADAPAWIAEATDAVRDAAAQAGEAAQCVASLFARDVAATRRAAVCTNLHEAVHDAVEHFREVFPESPAPEIAGPADVVTGIQKAELTRWLFRCLSGLSPGAVEPACVEVGSGPEGPLLHVELDACGPTGSSEALSAIEDEVRRAGGRLIATLGPRRCHVAFHLPPAPGGRSSDEIWERSA